MLRSARTSLLHVSWLLLATSSVAHAQTSAPDTRPIVGVLYFDNGAIAMDGRDYSPLTKGITRALIADLALRNPSIRVLERERIQSALEEQNLSQSGRIDPQTAIKLGKILGAKHMLYGGFIVDPKQRMEISVAAVNTETSEVVYGDKVKGKADDVLALIEQLADRINAGLHLPPQTPIREGAKSASAPSSLRAALALGSGMEAQDRKDIARAQAFVRDALKLAPDNAAIQDAYASLTRTANGK